VKPPGLIRRLGWLMWLAVLPGLGGFLGVVWFSDAIAPGEWSANSRVALTLLALGVFTTVFIVARERLVRPLQTAANILSGLREGDCSFRLRADGSDDVFAELMTEVNELADTVQQQRIGALEATALLRTVMAEIDVAVFAFDANDRLRLANRAGERLLGRPREQLLDRSADELGLRDCLEGEAPRTLQRAFAPGSGRWRLQRQPFRQEGRPHTLMVLSDLSRELREEEQQAWQRLVRVLGHELNNSLAPVKSIAGSLENLLQREPLPADWREDMREGLEVIASRAESLNRFVSAYARLARLPKPQRLPLPLAPLLHRVAGLEARVPVTLRPGPPCDVQGDADQLEQALINLVRNGADAVLAAVPTSRPASRPAGVELSWSRTSGRVEIVVADDGPGLANTANLFVPFFTTKPQGSGIGLALCRQIIEAHDGSLRLENRPDARGCLAVLRLPCREPELRTG